MADIVLKSRDGNPITYPGVTSVKLNTVGGEVVEFVDPTTVPANVEKTIDPDFSGGDMVVTPEEGTVFSNVTVTKPNTLIPGNIAKDVVIAGVTGTLEAGGGTGGGGEENSGHHVKVIDYDGTVLAEAYLNEGAVFSLPEAPTHDRLVFEGWSSPVEISNNAVTVEDHDIIVGAVYHTASGATEFDICLNTATGLSITFDDVLTGMTSIDWGDGAVDSTLTHTYADYGEYTIKIHGMTSIANSTTNITEVASDYRIQRVFLSASVTSIGEYAFYNCRGITTFVMPNGITEITKYAISSLYALKAFVIPNSVTTLRNYTLASSYSLESVVIPNSVTIFYQYAFYFCPIIESIVLPDSITGFQDYSLASCYNLKRVNLPKNIGSIAVNMFSSCHSLTSMVIPASCNLMWTSAFSSCSGMRVYDFSKHTSVPIGSSNMFSNIHGMCKILVPTSLYETWKAANYWSKIAGNLVPV